MRRTGLALFALVVGFGSAADAQMSPEQVMAALRAQGYSDISVRRTLLGRLLIVGVAGDHQREVVLNPTTGEVLRDYQRIEDADGSVRVGSKRAPTAAGPGGAPASSQDGATAGPDSHDVRGASTPTTETTGGTSQAPAQSSRSSRQNTGASDSASSDREKASKSENQDRARNSTRDKPDRGKGKANGASADRAASKRSGASASSERASSGAKGGSARNDRANGSSNRGGKGGRNTD